MQGPVVEQAVFSTDHAIVAHPHGGGARLLGAAGNDGVMRRTQPLQLQRLTCRPRYKHAGEVQPPIAPGTDSVVTDAMWRADRLLAIVEVQNADMAWLMERVNHHAPARPEPPLLSANR